MQDSIHFPACAEGCCAPTDSRLQRALDLAEAGWWNVDSNGKVEWSTNARRLMGVGPEQTIDVNLIASLLHPTHRNAYLAARQRLVEHGEAMDVEMLARGADGSDHWYEVHGRATLDAEGRVVEAGGVVQDVTRRRAAERTVRQLQAVLDNSALDIITVMDTETLQLTYVNRGAEVLLGYTREELLQMTGWQLSSDFDETAYREFLRPVLEGQSDGLTVETRNRCKGGGVVHLELTCQVIVPDEGQRLLVKVGRDVTARKAIEAEKSRLMHELEAKNKELESVLYAASHDLRSPLVNINGFSQSLQRSCAQLQDLLGQAQVAVELREALAPLLQTKIPKALRFIHSSTEKMQSLIEGLLRMSRTGRAPLNPEVLDMNALLERVLQEQAFQIGEAVGEVEVSLLPACRADSKLIAQVFSNLVDNALKYRDPNRPLRLQVTAQTLNEWVVYCVRDNGPGIPAEQIPRIWEVFGRLDPTGPVAGEGLGLKLARRIVERHGGALWAESEVGSGTRFFVRLPATC